MTPFSGFSQSSKLAIISLKLTLSVMNESIGDFPSSKIVIMLKIFQSSISAAH
jgi:hypothetical protein